MYPFTHPPKHSRTQTHSHTLAHFPCSHISHHPSSPTHTLAPIHPLIQPTTSYAWAFEQTDGESGHKFGSQDVFVPYHAHKHAPSAKSAVSTPVQGDGRCGGGDRKAAVVKAASSSTGSDIVGGVSPASDGDEGGAACTDSDGIDTHERDPDRGVPDDVAVLQRFCHVYVTATALSQSSMCCLFSVPVQRPLLTTYCPFLSELGVGLCACDTIWHAPVRLPRESSCKQCSSGVRVARFLATESHIYIAEHIRFTHAHDVHDVAPGTKKASWSNWWGWSPGLRWSKGGTTRGTGQSLCASLTLPFRRTMKRCLTSSPIN